jgi:ATP-binding cassette subfamily C protein CydCD
MSRAVSTRTSPLDALRVLSRGTLYLLGALGAAKAASLVGLATAIAMGVSGLASGQPDWPAIALWGFGSAVLRAITGWAQRVVSARAALGAKERLRAELAEHLVSGGGRRTASDAILGTSGLDELDKYFTVYLPAIVSAMTVPLLIGARILFADWLSALIIVITVPLIPVFMILIGLHTNERVAAATDALARLSDHLVELARGLPVLVGLGRAREQVGALRTISEDHRERTMGTLRTAFLSSLALELIATISVALVAVTIGIRLVHGDLTLETGLLVLLLAPECMIPFREIGAAFHSSEQGREALARVRAILGRPRGGEVERAAGAGVRVETLTVSYGDRAASTISGLDFEARRGAITLIDGRSGAGKSTVLAAMADQLGEASVDGRIVGVDTGSLAWLPQAPHTTADTVLGELLLYGTGDDLAEEHAHEALRMLQLGHLAATDPAVVSPGELRRVGLARVLMRVHAGAEVVLLDEPTADLDANSAAIVVAAILGIRARATIVIASHDRSVRAIADHRVLLGESSAGIAPRADVADDDERRAPRERTRRRPNAAPFRELLRFLRPGSGRTVAAGAFGLFAALFSIALTALSGWLIVRASEQPPIMYLLVAIVGVRFFGVGRAALRYCERLFGHDAALTSATGLRMRLWSGLAERGTRDRAILGGGSTLDRLVRGVDEVRDLSLRVVQPFLVGVLATVAVVAVLGAIFPPALPLLLALAVIGLLIAPVTALLADRASARGQQLLRSRVLGRFAAMLGAAGDLRANGVDGVVRGELRELDAAASRTARRGAWALGLGSALVVAACCATSVALLFVVGSLPTGLAAVLVLTPLGLVDPLLEFVAAVQQWPALAQALSVTTIDAAEEAEDAPTGRPGATIEHLALEAVEARWPDSSEVVVGPIDASVARGEWLVITGPSGAGKSTLLSVLLGQLRPSAGRYLVDGTDAAALDPVALGERFGWCPQGGYLFDSTLRANLLLARPRDNAPSEGEMREALAVVGLGELLDRLPRGLDTRIGAGGGFLSGGERQRVAVARTLLTRAPVILIDEPTAHLDEESAVALMADLRIALADRIAVLVTHHPIGLSADDRRIDLTAVGTPRRPLAVLPSAQSLQAVGGAA